MDVSSCSLQNCWTWHLQSSIRSHTRKIVNPYAHCNLIFQALLPCELRRVHSQAYMYIRMSMCMFLNYWSVSPLANRSMSFLTRPVASSAAVCLSAQMAKLINLLAHTNLRAVGGRNGIVTNLMAQPSPRTADVPIPSGVGVGGRNTTSRCHSGTKNLGWCAFVGSLIMI